MPGFSRSAPPTTCKACEACKQRFEQRKALIQSARDKAAKDGGAAGAAAKTQADRFDKYNTAMPRAKAAADVYDPGKEPCLKRITDPKELEKMGLKPSDLRDDKSGFHAEVYQSAWDGKTILAYQGTDPTSLNDWKTNIDNGLGQQTDQYTEAGSLASKMQQSGTSFDITGHSLGGGLAQEGGLVSTNSDVYTFNSAGLSDNSLKWTGASSFDSLDSRTQAFRTQDDFLTGIQENRDPQAQATNAENLSKEIKGAYWKNPLYIQGYNSETNKSPAFQADRQGFYNQVDGLVSKAQSDVAAGQDPGLFPAAHGTKTNVPGLTWTSDHINDRLSKLNQHTMDSMITQMEKQKTADEKALKTYTGTK